MSWVNSTRFPGDLGRDLFSPRSATIVAFSHNPSSDERPDARYRRSRNVSILQGQAHCCRLGSKANQVGVDQIIDTLVDAGFAGCLQCNEIVNTLLEKIHL